MQEYAMQLLKLVLFNPASRFELIVSATLAVAVFIGLLNMVGGAFDLKLAQTGRSVVVLGLLVVVEVAAYALIKSRLGLAGWMQGAIMASLLLIVIVPGICLLLKGNYMSSLFTLLIGMAGAVLIILLARTVFGAISRGSESTGQGRRHNRDIREVLGQ